MDWHSVLIHAIEDTILALDLCVPPSARDLIVLLSALDLTTASWRMSRVALSKIRSLTLYRGELTKSRRVAPVTQLKCIGNACSLFQPEVVRCVNNGGTGVDIDWTVCDLHLHPTDADRLTCSSRSVKLTCPRSYVLGELK